MPRFLLRPEAIEGRRVRFDAVEARHLGRVRRLRPGAVLEATDGAGRVYRVRLDALAGASAEGTILLVTEVALESPCAVTLAQGVLKGDRMAWIVQKATELGVTRIVPLETERVVARPRGERASLRHTRWQRVAREAVKQCGRTRVPVVEPPAPLSRVLAEVPAHDVAWLCWERGGLSIARAAGIVGRPRRVLLVVGPEGGFTELEVTQAEAAGVALVGLGPRTLRADVAGLVAVALCQYLFGDLGGETTVSSMQP